MATEPDYVEAEARASIAGLRFGQRAIVDRADPDVLRYLRAGLLVVTGGEVKA